MSGSAMPWSPPRTIGRAPAASTSPTVRSIAAWLATGRRAGPGRRRSRPRAARRSRRCRPRGAARAGSWRRGSRAARSARRDGRRRGRRSGRRRSRRRRRRARPGPRCRACPEKLGRPAKSGFSPNSRQRSSGSITSRSVPRHAPADGPKSRAGMVFSAHRLDFAARWGDPGRKVRECRRSSKHGRTRRCWPPVLRLPRAPGRLRAARRLAAAARAEDLLRHQRHRRLGRLRPVQRRPAQAPGADRELPHLGLGLPRVDQALAGGPGAADPALHDRRPRRRARDHHPAGDRPGRRRRVPDPPQQAVLGEEDARLRAAAGRAQPLPQRLRVLRLRRQPARRRAQAALVPAAPSAASTSCSTGAASGTRSTPASPTPACRRSAPKSSACRGRRSR